MKQIDSFHHLAAPARAADHDRYLCSLFLPSRARAASFTLILFNAEIARVFEAVSEPMLGQIRLQWWREAIDEIYQGGGRKHEVAEPLARAIRRHNFTRSYFDRLIDAREMDLAAAPPEDMAALENYAEESAAPLISLSLEVMGADANAQSELARHTGIGWALSGLMRALPHHTVQGRALLPGGIPAREEVPRVVATVGDMARQHIDKARALRRQATRGVKRATLPAVLADAYLSRLAACGYDPYNPGSAIGPLRRQLLLSRAAFLGLS
jgi:phytoene synthase